MTTVRVSDKEFELFIPYEKILSVVEQLAGEMNEKLKDEKPLFLSILNGSFMFAADLFKCITLPDAEISFVKMASYEGENSTGVVKELLGLNEDITGRTVVVLEDIVDSGNTIKQIIEQLKNKKVKEVKVATLLFKPESLKEKIKPDYVGFEIPDDFIVGYGLDYNGKGRNLIDIYKIKTNT